MPFLAMAPAGRLGRPSSRPWATQETTAMLFAYTNATLLLKWSKERSDVLKNGYDSIKWILDFLAIWQSVSLFHLSSRFCVIQ